MNKEAIATLTVYIEHMQDQYKHENLDGLSNTLQKARKYIQNNCNHETINIGDDEHIIDTCTLCGWIQPPYDTETPKDEIPY